MFGISSAMLMKTMSIVLTNGTSGPSSLSTLSSI